MKPIVGIGVLIIKDEKILLGKRNKNPGKNTYSLPGGKLEFGESFEECARREVKEETGLEIKEFKFICVNNDIFENNHFVTLGFVAKDFYGEPKNLEEEINTWEWFDLKNLPKNIFIPSKKIIEKYLSDRNGLL